MTQPAVSKNPDGSSRSRLQEKLFERLQALRAKDDKNELWEGFASAWAVAFATEAFGDAEALLVHLLQQRPVDVLQRLLSLVPKLHGGGGAARVIPEAVLEVVVGLCLVACESHVLAKARKHKVMGRVAPIDGMLIDATKPLAAALIAAVWSGKGVRIRFDEATQQARAVNVMPQHAAPLEYGFHGAEQGAKAELQAMVNAAILDPTLASFDRPARLNELRDRSGKPGMLPSDDILKAGIDEYEEKHGARLMFGLAAQEAHPMDDPALRRAFARRFGVVTFLYDDAASALIEQPRAEAWREANLQTDLLHYLDNLFALIYPQHKQGDDQAAGSRRDMHFRVALSFADEHYLYVEGIARALEDKLGKGSVFYYKDDVSRTTVDNMDTLLEKVYHRQSDLAVVFLSKQYQEKRWCQLEWRAVRARRHRDARGVMLCRFDDAEVDGVFLTVDGVHDCRQPNSSQAITACILRRLDDNRRSG
ncbi:MAG: TIR domain-containing protein [Candidatus Accumulibacter sp.]|nr:TIR domain-containing protein [Accumulibacter sp.]